MIEGEPQVQSEQPQPDPNTGLFSPSSFASPVDEAMLSNVRRGFQYGASAPIPYNPNYGIPAKRAENEYDDELFQAAQLANDVGTRILHSMFHVGWEDFGDEPLTATDYFSDTNNVKMIQNTPGGMAVYNKWQMGGYDHITDKNTLLNTFAYDIERNKSMEALNRAPGLVRFATTTAAGLTDPVFFAANVASGAMISGVAGMANVLRIASTGRNIGRIVASELAQNTLAETISAGLATAAGSESQSLGDSTTNVAFGTILGSFGTGAFRWRSIERASRLNRLVKGVTLREFTPSDRIRSPGTIMDTEPVINVTSLRTSILNVIRSNPDLLRTGNITPTELDKFLFTFFDNPTFRGATPSGTAIAQARRDIVQAYTEFHTARRGNPVYKKVPDSQILQEFVQVHSAYIDELMNSRVNVRTRFNERTGTFRIEHVIINEDGTDGIVLRTQTFQNASRDYVEQLVSDMEEQLSMLDAGKSVDPIRDYFADRLEKGKRLLAAMDSGKPIPDELRLLVPSSIKEYNPISQKTGEALLTEAGRTRPVFFDEIAGKLSGDTSVNGPKPNEGKLSDYGEGVVEIVKGAGDETLTKMMKNPSLSPLTWAKTFIEELWENVGEAIGLPVEKDKLRRIRMIYRMADNGVMQEEELAKIMKGENLYKVRNAALVWKTAGQLFLTAGIGFGAHKTGLLKVAKNFLFGEEISKSPGKVDPQMVGIGTAIPESWMNDTERSNMNTSFNAMLANPMLAAGLMSIVDKLVEMNELSPDSPEVSELRSLYNEMKVAPGPEKTRTFNLKARELLRGKLPPSEENERKDRRDLLKEIGYGDAFDELIDRHVDVAHNFKSSLHKFSGTIITDDERTAIRSAITDSLDNPLRETIGSYGRQVGAFFDEIVRRSGKKGNLFKAATMDLRSKLSKVDPALLTGLDGGGEGFATNFILQAIGAAMLAYMESPQPTDEELNKSVLKHANTDTIEHELINNAYGVLTMDVGNTPQSSVGAHAPTNPSQLPDFAALLRSYDAYGNRIQSGKADKKDYEFALTSGYINLLLATQKYTQLTAMVGSDHVSVDATPTEVFRKGPFNAAYEASKAMKGNWLTVGNQPEMGSAEGIVAMLGVPQMTPPKQYDPVREMNKRASELILDTIPAHIQREREAVADELAGAAGRKGGGTVDKTFTKAFVKAVKGTIMHPKQTIEGLVEGIKKEITQKETDK